MLDWISGDAWEAFKAMRKQIKAPLTPYAEKLIERELCKLKAAGHDPQACLDQSILNCWRDVYPLKAKAIATLRDACEDTRRYLEELDAIKPDPERARAAIAAARLRIIQ